MVFINLKKQQNHRKEAMYKIFKIDNHDQSYQIWKDNNIKNSIVIHIDAHMDFVTGTYSYMFIGNYLNYAFDEQIINTMVWVIPDPSFLDEFILDNLIETSADYFKLVFKSKDMVLLKGNKDIKKRLIITRLSKVSNVMARMNDYEDVLVDIDIDYFVNPYVHITYSNYYQNSYWIKCNEVCEAIRPLLMLNKCKLITIARSIYGGYTPLLYSFICDQLYDTLMDNYTRIKEYVNLERAIVCLNNNHLEASELFERSLYYPECHLSSIVGLLYCYTLSGYRNKAEKYYTQLLAEYPAYEPYIFPVHAMLKNHHIAQANPIIDAWLVISSTSNQANLYKLKTLSNFLNCLESQYVELSNSINDAETFFEKSYIMSNYYLEIHRYDEAIECCEKVLSYLRHNDSPLWVGQISSYERRKNHGHILAFLFEKMALAYFKKQHLKDARKYALMCNKIGYQTQTIEHIVNNS